MQREKYLNVSERVRVISGPLIGVEGIVTRTHEVSRVVVSISAIKQSVSVQVSAEFLEVIHKNNE
jgi:transcription antitermination factor NusG